MRLYPGFLLVVRQVQFVPLQRKQRTPYAAAGHMLSPTFSLVQHCKKLDARLRLCSQSKLRIKWQQPHRY